MSMRRTTAAARTHGPYLLVVEKHALIGQLHAVLQVVAARQSHVTRTAKQPTLRYRGYWGAGAARDQVRGNTSQSHVWSRLTAERPAQPVPPREHRGAAVPPRRRWARQRRVLRLCD